jgi:predicted phage terminase large subunit-like protein
MLGIIDDPFENWAQAQSPTIREHVWDWYRTTFRTRVWEGGAIVIICTRWHDDDLAGRLLRQQGEGWQVLRLPAIAETREERAQNNAFLGLPALGEDPLGRAPGEPLCPGRFSLAALRELRRDVGEIGWAAEYQGVPRPAGGSVFKREWFEVVEDYPRDAPVVRYWDLAGSEVNSRSPDPDWSTGLKMCRTREGVYYITNVRRARERPLGVERFVTATAAMDGPDTPIWIEQEGGSSGATVIDNYVRRLLAGYAVRADKVANDKMTRAMPFIAQCEAGNVKLVRGDWVQDFLDELETFPNGAHDDQVDTASGAYRKLTPLGGAQQSNEQPDFDHGHMRDAAYRQELRPRTVTVGRRGSR